MFVTWCLPLLIFSLSKKIDYKKRGCKLELVTLGTTIGFKKKCWRLWKVLTWIGDNEFKRSKKHHARWHIWEKKSRWRWLVNKNNYTGFLYSLLEAGVFLTLNNYKRCQISGYSYPVSSRLPDVIMARLCCQPDTRCTPSLLSI